MRLTAFDWRPVEAPDVPALASIYRDAARELGQLVYTPEQASAWASFADDEPGFRRYVLESDTWVAARPADGAPIGFCGIGAAGESREVHALYVAPASTRQGLGREMLARSLRRAEAAGARRFAAWVTPFSRPVFLAAGFAWTRTVSEPFAGTLFERYRVERG